jgi:hypothetical protein
LKRTIAATDKAIDALVYVHYGLTGNGIRTIKAEKT